MLQQNYSGKLVLFGAGKIGRSFIAQLFSNGGYETVFIDIDSTVVNGINRLGTYNVIIKDREEKRLPVSGIRAVHLNNTEKIVDEIVTADILAVSVGQKGLPNVVHLMALAAGARQKLFPGKPLDIIIAENMRDASEWMKRQFTAELPEDFPIESYLGLIETSIGKMVPLMTATDQQENPLNVFAENYNTLILDKKAFKNPIPDIPGLAPKDNMKAWVDRKLFIHNLGHAALAYFSYLKNPDLTYTWEALEDAAIRHQVSVAMHESAAVLRQQYPDEFTDEALEEHIYDLLSRFANRSLGDTIFRVGCDLERKLGPEDRLVPVIRLACQQGLPYDKVLEALVSGIFFDARDVQGNRHPADTSFLQKFNRRVTDILQFHCNFDPLKFHEIYSKALLFESKLPLTKNNSL